MSGLHTALGAITKKTDDLFAFEIEGLEVVFRLPSIRQAQQYTMLLKLCDSDAERSEVYESLFRYLVEDEWLAAGDSDLKAGVPETVGRLAIMLSGLDDRSIEYTQTLFDMYRQQADFTLNYMKRIICQVFSGYTFESLDLLNYQQVVNVFIQAEKVLLDRGIIEKEHDFQSPGEAKAPQFRVEDVIKNDGQAFSEFDKPEQEDPRVRARMQQIREGVAKRAQEEERRYKQQLAMRDQNR